MATRQEVYEALDTEREYQERRWGGEDQNRKHEVASWILYMQEYLTEAIHTASRSGDETLALDSIRKVTALGVACMEVHGAPHRK
jgi:hypothetical protein